MEYVGDDEGLTLVDRALVERLLRERLVARRAGEFGWADRLRAELERLDVIIMDRNVGRDGTSEGVMWVVRRPDGQHRHLAVTGPHKRKAVSGW